MRLTLVLVLSALAAALADDWPATAGVATPFGGRNAWAVSSDTAVVLRTTDFGVTWMPQDLPTYRCPRDVHFIDDLRGWTAGPSGDIWHTPDGGDSWVRQSLGGPYWVNRIRFVDSLWGWAVGECEVHLRTTDGGGDWRQMLLWVAGGDDSAGFWGCSFTSHTRGWLASGIMCEGGRSRYGQGRLYLTVDGGDSWTMIRRDILNDYMDVVFWDSLRGLVVGGVDVNLTGAIQRTVDGGRVWMDAVLPVGTGFLRAVKLVGERHLWACGHAGTIVHSSDRGASWELQPTSVQVPLYDIDFADTLRGMAAGQHVILVTTDGGRHWNECYGIQEERTFAGPRPTATICRGVLHLPRDMTEFGSANLDRVPRLLDITGRKAADLKPGPNDVSRLPAGVYFVAARGAGTVQRARVVLLR